MYKVPPLGLSYLAAVLKRKGFEIQILDLNVEKDCLDDMLDLYTPEIVGVSSTVANVHNVFKVITQVKTQLPECFIVLGGPYPSLMRERLLAKHREIDAAIIGEGEFTLLELFERLQNKRELDGINGLIFRCNNKVKSNNLRSIIKPLDSLPFPAREELPMKSYTEIAGVIFTSRGCPYQCIFCSRPVFGREWRGHSAEYVLEEIVEMKKAYGIKYLSFLDDNFTFDADRTVKILDKIHEKKLGLGLYFWNGIRPDLVTKEILLKMKKAGCVAINYGLESVDSEVLANIKKGLILEQVEKTIRLTHQVGIRANVFLMVGNPGDTVNVVEQIKDFVERTKVNGIHLSIATPFPRTELWDWVEKNGRWLDYNRKELIDWPVDDADVVYPVFDTSEFTAEEKVESYQRIRDLLSKKELLL